MKQKLYRCDPDKNTLCKKTYCYRKYPECCRRTTDKKFRMSIFKRIKEAIMESEYKIVDFKKYCATCKYKKVKETNDPCNECLDKPVNLHSEKPVKYKEEE